MGVKPVLHKLAQWSWPEQLWKIERNDGLTT